MLDIGSSADLRSKQEVSIRELSTVDFGHPALLLLSQACMFSLQAKLLHC